MSDEQPTSGAAEPAAPPLPPQAPEAQASPAPARRSWSDRFGGARRHRGAILVGVASFMAGVLLTVLVGAAIGHHGRDERREWHDQMMRDRFGGPGGFAPGQGPGQGDPGRGGYGFPGQQGGVPAQPNQPAPSAPSASPNT